MDDSSCGVSVATDDLPEQPTSVGNAVGVHLGRFAGLQDGIPMVRTVASQVPIACLACGWMPKPDQIGAIVAVLFDSESSGRAILLGPIVSGLDTLGGDDRVAIHSDTEIRLTCGQATLSLKADGTVAIRGVNVASRASHTNRIRGGNVQIN